MKTWLEGISMLETQSEMNLEVPARNGSLNFLMITTFYPPYNFGGDGIYIYRLSNELARLGHHVDVVHCVDAYECLEKKGPKGDYPVHAGIKVHRLRSGVGVISPLLTQQTSYPFFKAAEIKRVLQSKSYDVIHFHNISLIGLNALKLGSAIKLYTMHEHWLVCAMHVLWRFEREVCTKRTCISCQIRGKRPVQWWRYFGKMRRCLNHIDAFISPSHFTRRKHHEMGFTYPITHIPYFLPTYVNKAEPREFAGGSPGNRPFFLFVGRLEKIKGVQNLIPVFKEYQACDLIVAGDGDYEPKLRQLAAGMDNIKFLGRVAYDRLEALYQNALAVIVPSICVEVFGIIIIEAFAKRTPVIVNNLGAMPEVVQQSGGGFIYDSQEELLDSMEQLRKNRALRKQLGEQGYAAYQRYWSEKAHLHQYFKLIDAVADRKRRAVGPPLQEKSRLAHVPEPADSDVSFH